MYKNILVALDLADQAMDFKLLAAADVLAAEGAKIKCVHVVESLPTYALAQVPDDVMPRVLAIATADTEERLDATGVAAAVDVRSGNPATTVLEVADEMSADAIVVGSHKPGFQDIFLGSTAARVVRHANCDVLVRRPDAK
jgi:universal stress protein F